MKETLIKILVFTLVLFSCRGKKQAVLDEAHFKGMDRNDFAYYADTLQVLEQTSLPLDSFDYTWYIEMEKSYNLLVHETGQIKKGKNDYGISLLSINDDDIVVKLLKKKRLKWQVCDTVLLKDIRFSPVSFSLSYADYNNDGVKDIDISFYQSMSVGYAHGYIVLIAPDKEDNIILLKNSIDIPNLRVDQGKITSTTYNHPGHERVEYKKVETFVVEGDSLKLVDSKKTYE